MDFSNFIKDSKKRQLTEISDIKIQKDVFKIRFLMNSNVKESQLNYDVVLKSWSIRHMELGFEFEDPTLISRGFQQDIVFITVLEKILFSSTAADGGMEDSFTFSAAFPRQLPKVSAESLVSVAENSKVAVQSVFVAEFVITQVFFDGVLYEMWTLFYTLQLICYIKIFDIMLPASTQVFLTSINRIIEFEFINLEMIIKKFDPSFDLLTLLGFDELDPKAIKVLPRLRFILIIFTQVLCLSLITYIL